MSSAILELKNISVSFDGFKALQNVNLAVDYNSIHFLIGPNGAGKTTLLDIICGKTRSNSGEVLYKDYGDISKMKDYKIIDLGIGRKFQAPSVFINLTVLENMKLAVKQNKGLTYTLFGNISKEKEQIIDDVLETINLKDHRFTFAGSLSHGQKQWLEIGMLLVQKPDLLLLDEPVAGMGKSETEKTGQLLQKISKRSSVVVVEHDMEFVRNFATKVDVLHQGMNLCNGSVYDVQSDPRVIEVYIGRAGDKSA